MKGKVKTWKVQRKKNEKVKKTCQRKEDERKEKRNEKTTASGKLWPIMIVASLVQSYNCVSLANKLMTQIEFVVLFQLNGTYLVSKSV